MLWQFVIFTAYAPQMRLFYWVCDADEKQYIMKLQISAIRRNYEVPCRAYIVDHYDI